MERKKKGTAVVVGGSIGGVSCAHALVAAGWEVVVLEKSAGPPTGSPTGAGLCLEPLAQRLIDSWVGATHLLRDATIPLTIDLNQSTDGEKKVSWTLTRDENFNFRAAHWADLHSLLYNALPPSIFLWGHLFLSLCTSGDNAGIKIKAKVLQTDEIVEIAGDLLVAADGCLSSIRKIFLPDLKLRYSGYCAWRGVLDFSDNENSEIITGLRKAYPDMGKCFYVDLGYRTHAILYELPNKRMNWIWYVGQPEPKIQRNSLTTKVSRDMIEAMLEEAEKVWTPELVKVMKATKEPFLNIIYDCEPPEQVFWGNVVLVGDAAHPTTPHCVRATNMSLLDAAVLGKCLEKWGAENLRSALEEYQSVRVTVTTKQVLHSRRMGCMKQGLDLPDRRAFDPMTAIPGECEELLQKNMPFSSHVPAIVESLAGSCNHKAGSALKANGFA